MGRPCEHRLVLERLVAEVSLTLTGNSTVFVEGDGYSYELYRELSDIENRTTTVRRPQTNGLLKPLREAPSVRVPEGSRANRVYESLDHLHTDLDEDLDNYNYEHPPGLSRHGNRPFETINEYLLLVKKT